MLLPEIRQSVGSCGCHLVCGILVLWACALSSAFDFNRVILIDSVVGCDSTSENIAYIFVIGKASAMAMSCSRNVALLPNLAFMS
jgi:hypothetical protein